MGDERKAIRVSSYPARIQWEYKMVNIMTNLNDLGQYGWEAVGISDRNILMKRPAN